VDETLTIEAPYDPPAAPEQVWGLAVAWCLDEPERVGQVLVLDTTEATLGRGGGRGEPRVLTTRIRPGHTELLGPLTTRRVSRRQLLLTDAGDALRIRNTGKTPLVVNGRQVAEATVGPGDVVSLHQALVTVVVRRSLEPAALDRPLHPFGAVDADGLVGESAAAWGVRREVDFVAARPGHVLLLGPSGAGKELAARGVHRASGVGGEWVARNAATIPESLADAELFGNLANYPNPGMPARPGLVGQADGGMLLLDEVGDLPEPVQARLLRLLDDGEYQRLGEATTRRSSARVLGATHRRVEGLKHDLVARFRHRIEVPGLAARPDDVPLLVAHLLRQARDDDPSLGRFFAGPHPRLAPRMMEALLRWPWATHVRELDRVLWDALRHSPGDHLDLQQVPAAAEPPTASSPPTVDPASLSVAQIEAALVACDGVVSQAYKELGLNSRDQLRRLMKKHDIQRP